MKIIPAINCENFDCVKEKLRQAAEFAPPAGGWVQVDVADGKFTEHKTWNKPEELINQQSITDDQRLNMEVHLMVENPEEVVDGWLNALRLNSGQAGAKRIIVHWEAVKNSAAKNPDNDESDIINLILFKCEGGEAELGLAVNPETSIEEILPYLNRIKFVQILAVEPGLAGQKFQEKVLDKIRFLKELGGKRPDVAVEVDGGINIETAELCKLAGADILAAASYIWNSQNPGNAFAELSAV